MQLAVFADGGECFLLDRCRAELNALEYTRVENVYTSIDAVAHELNRLLHKSVNPRGVVGLVHNNTIFGRLLDFRHDDSTLLSVRFVEVGQLLKWIVTNHIRVEYEEWGIIFPKNLFCQLQRPGGAEGFGLDRELDLDVVFFLVLCVSESVSLIH